MTWLDLDARYTVDDYGAGIAWYLLGYELVQNEDYEWSGIEYKNRERVRAVMVGDDRVSTFDIEQLTILEDEDYCHECGQVGCTADGRA